MKISFSSSQDAKDTAFMLSRQSNGKLKSSSVMQAFAKDNGFSTAKQFLDHLDSIYNKHALINFDHNKQFLKIQIASSEIIVDRDIEEVINVPVSTDEYGNLIGHTENILKHHRWGGNIFINELAQIIKKCIKSDDFNLDAAFSHRAIIKPDEIEEFFGNVSDDIYRMASKPYMSHIIEIFNNEFTQSEQEIDFNGTIEAEFNWVKSDFIKSIGCSLCSIMALAASCQDTKEAFYNDILELLNNPEFKCEFVLNVMHSQNDE